MKKALPVIIIVLLGTTVLPAQTKPVAPQTDECYRWRTQVDPSLERITVDESKLTDDEVLTGIGCLLKLEGNTKKARITGTTKGNWQSADEYKEPKQATIEIFALYYASYIFYDDWQFAYSILIYEQKTMKENTHNLAKRAYRYYRAWFKKIQQIGLPKAREQKLDPLEGSGIFWR